MKLSACGLICDECEFYNKTCTGCLNVKGSTFWAKEMLPGKVCPMYDCSVNKNQLVNCGGCNEIPCDLYRSMKDPNSTEDEHLKSINIRVERLKGN